MRRTSYPLLVVILLVSMSWSGTLAQTPGSDVNTAATCPVTFQPGLLDDPPMGWGSYETAYGGEDLRATLKHGGVFMVTDTLVNEAGEFWDKFLFWAPEFSSSSLEVTGHRLDAEAPPLRADPSSGTAGGLAAILYFPTTGCWEVTGTRGDDSVTFVLLVVRVPEFDQATSGQAHTSAP